MRVLKFFKIILPTFLIISFTAPNVEAAEECFEGVSRSVFKFNMAFDKAVLKPIAKGYNKLPEPIKNGTSNFTSNMATLLSIPNSLLQGNIKQVGHSTGSFLVNSTVQTKVEEILPKNSGAALRDFNKQHCFGVILASRTWLQGLEFSAIFS